MERMALLFLSILCSFAHAEDFPINEYELNWTTSKAGNASMSVIKTYESTYIRLYVDNGFPSYLRLTGDEAVSISKALAKTKEFFEKQKAAKDDKPDSVTAGAFKVTFRTSPKYGFSVNINKASGLSRSHFSLSRLEAINLQPSLAKASKMIEFIDHKIDF